MLENNTLSKLKNKKNLLAFSGGVDSSALFFILQENGIKFDIAIVDYGLREQSKEEVTYAKDIALKYNLTCHIHNAQKIEKNFESSARKIRYDFFEKLISSYKYNNLLTAHHLGDRFEWMLMQFCKGAGCVELAGMKSVEQRDNYQLIRPLLGLDKSELLEFLNTKNIIYFQDKSNLNEDIKRNSFRHNYATPLLEKYLNGIKKSFVYLDEDKQNLLEKIEIETIDKFAYFKNSQNQRANIYSIDKYLKSKQHLLSANERELLKNENTVVIGRKFIVNQNEFFIFIAPYLSLKSSMSREFKEECRALKIEPKLRLYLYQDEKAFFKVKELFSNI
ncbi:MAG: tRNA lysidine(34) synthetase TilS [Sulfurimonas sp.]|nr:tRNA lysidine(34) synthetase TilS [Sulfurimonas sp.]